MEPLLKKKEMICSIYILQCYYARIEREGGRDGAGGWTDGKLFLYCLGFYVSTVL